MGSVQGTGRRGDLWCRCYMDDQTSVRSRVEPRALRFCNDKSTYLPTWLFIIDQQRYGLKAILMVCFGCLIVFCGRYYSRKLDGIRICTFADQCNADIILVMQAMLQMNGVRFFTWDAWCYGLCGFMGYRLWIMFWYGIWINWYTLWIMRRYRRWDMGHVELINFL